MKTQWFTGRSPVKVWEQLFQWCMHIFISRLQNRSIKPRIKRITWIWQRNEIHILFSLLFEFWQNHFSRTKKVGMGFIQLLHLSLSSIHWKLHLSSLFVFLFGESGCALMGRTALSSPRPLCFCFSIWVGECWRCNTVRRVCEALLTALCWGEWCSGMFKASVKS